MGGPHRSGARRLGLPALGLLSNSLREISWRASRRSVPRAGGETSLSCDGSHLRRVEKSWLCILAALVRLPEHVCCRISGAGRGRVALSRLVVRLRCDFRPERGAADPQPGCTFFGTILCRVAHAGVELSVCQRRWGSPPGLVSPLARRPGVPDLSFVVAFPERVRASGPTRMHPMSRLLHVV